jgi:hypothetical protein
MGKQALLWTALPNGYSDDQTALRVSVLVSPRLNAESDPPPHVLLNFPDFLDWPATLANAKFTVHYGGGVVAISGSDTSSPSRIDKSLGEPDTSVWQALLPGETPVTGFAFKDLSNNKVLSYPAAKIDTLIRTLYSAFAATAKDDLPKISEFLNHPEWSKIISAIASIDRQSLSGDGKMRDPRQQFKGFKDGGFGEPGSLARELALFQLFHTPPSSPEVGEYPDVPAGDPKSYAKWLGFKQTPLPKPGDFVNIYDFHKIVGAMNQYPTLLRRLGLVVDLLIEKSKFAASPNALLWVDVVLPSLPAGSNVTRLPDVSMRTRTKLDAKRFQPLPRTAPGQGDYRATGGLLVLDPDLFQLVQVDGDGAGLKVMNFARTLAQMKSKPTQQRDPVTQHEHEDGAPALRNAGLMLVHTDRGAMLENSFDRQKSYNDVAEQIQGGAALTQTLLKKLEMFAEDLVRGYRIDVWDSKTKQWRSLCQRAADYNISGAADIHVENEEGTLRLGATKSPDPGSNPDLVWLHEAVLSWTGWSLCARAPGKTIHHQATEKDSNGKDIIVHKDSVGEAEAEVPPGLRMKTAFNALAGSLPRLRYGRAYWIRARIVDLASNSLPPQPKDFGPEAPMKNQVLYLRYEPISAPALALVKPMGEPVEAPAEGESMEVMAVRTFNNTPDQNTVQSTQIAQRFVVPARTSARDAELHGMLDTSGKVDPAKFGMLAVKDNSLAEETLKLKGPLDVAPVDTRFAMFEDGALLPYLPEPLAVVVVARIFGHPTFSADKLIPIQLYTGAASWPDAVPFKIELYEKPTDEPRFDETQRTLFIPLPKGVRATLRLSVQPTRESLALLGVWHWLTPSQQTALRKRALSGQHWMLTPWRNVTVVHAVQKPLITPKITQLRIGRGLGSTHATPNFIATCSIKSTDHLDLRADWNEPIEDVSKGAAGTNRTRTDHAFSVKITDEKSYGGKHEYLLTATDLVQAGGAFHDLVAEKFHEFNDTRYRRIEYWLEASTRFREFMPPNVLTKVEGTETVATDEHIKVVGEKVVAWIPNSSPPPAPEVLYVVPTFGWVRTQSEKTKSSWRRGGGLRVYLNRPWNVSGYGEMLAVVLPSTKFTGDPNTAPAQQPLKKFVTQWGNDPIWLSAGIAGVAPKAGNFPLARTSRDPTGNWLPSFAPPNPVDPTAPSPEADQPAGPFKTTGLLHPETASIAAQFLVDIAPHDVFYDNERQLWYCDLEVNWGNSYYPFIRLALSRYQPISVGGAHLSSIVLADFIPLVSDRWLSVTQTKDPKTRTVSVFGSTYSDCSSRVEAKTAPGRRAAHVARSSVIEVWVERLNPALGEDFGWTRETDAVITPATKSKKKRPKKASSSLKRAKQLLRRRAFSTLLSENLVDRVFISPPLWSGTMTLPETSGAAMRYRLVIAEFEEYLVDDANPYDAIPTRKDRRLVFVEYVELS